MKCWTSPSSWWFQPLWKICSSKWTSSPNRGEKKIFELPPPSKGFLKPQIFGRVFWQPFLKTSAIWRGPEVPFDFGVSTTPLKTNIPIGSMYVWYIYLHLAKMYGFHVGKYAIHGSYGIKPEDGPPRKRRFRTWTRNMLSLQDQWSVSVQVSSDLKPLLTFHYTGWVCRDPYNSFF